jgi:transposase-like protein
MGYWKTTKAQRDDILDRYRNGQTIEEIARQFGIHDSYVCRLAQKYGLEMRGRGYWNSQLRSSKQPAVETA